MVGSHKVQRGNSPPFFVSAAWPGRSHPGQGWQGTVSVPPACGRGGRPVQGVCLWLCSWPPRVLLKSCGLSPDAPCPTSSFGKARGVQLHGLAVTVTELLLVLSPAGLGPS